MAAFFRKEDSITDDVGDVVVSEGEAVIAVDGIKRPWWKYLVGALLIIILVLMVASYFKLLPPQLFPSGNGYQAVFLSNGQVYFGKLYEQDSQFAVLRDIYYLQVTQPPQPIQPGGASPSNINLVKLGGELHRPQDEMRINRDHILFVEDLTPTSQVVTAINKLKSGGK